MLFAVSLIMLPHTVQAGKISAELTGGIYFINSINHDKKYWK